MSTTSSSDALPEAGDAVAPELRASAAYVLGQLRLPSELTVELLAVGTLRLRPRLIEQPWCSSSSEGGAQVEAIALTCAGLPAVLRVERRTARGLLDAVLGLPATSFVGPLSHIERGVLEGTLATVLARLRQTRAFEVRGGVADDGLVGSFVIEISVRFGEETGRAWLLASEAALERLWTTRETTLDETPLWLEVARTRVPRREITSAEVGDLIVFDETAALSPTSEWPANLSWHGRALAVRWSAEGLVVGLAAPAGEVEAVTRPEHKPVVGDAWAGDGGEDGSVVVSAGVECESVWQGGEEPLVVHRGNQVCIKVGGSVFGRGSLTQHDGAFAVAITLKVNG